METIFTVKSQDLWRLNPEEAVSRFSDLLWAEARRLGIPIGKIHVSSWIDVPDGGVDASVEENTLPAKSDLIKTGTTSYQVKAGASFKPWQDSQIKEELFGSKGPSKGNLGSGVAACLDAEGTYVLVCFKQDPTDEQRREALQNLRKYLNQCGYPNPKVEAWGQSNLIGFLEVFPSLALELNERGGLRFQTHKSWSQDAEMRKELKAGPAQEELISSIQNELRRDTDSVHIRIWGEPGIGKTKLVLEATRVDDLRPCVIYCDSARKFRDSDLMSEILKEDNKFHVVLVHCAINSRLVRSTSKTSVPLVHTCA